MKTVLIVEDDSIIAMDMAQILKGSGYDVEIATDGVEGLGKIKQKAYDLDLVIVSNNMPLMNGEELYKEVLVLNKDLAKKIVFVSAHITDFIKSTGNSYLVKPFSDEQFLEAVKKIIT